MRPRTTLGELCATHADLEATKQRNNDREMQKGDANRATLAVARKLVAYLIAVDRWQTYFLVIDQETGTAA